VTKDKVVSKDFFISEVAKVSRYAVAFVKNITRLMPKGRYASHNEGFEADELDRAMGMKKLYSKFIEKVAASKHLAAARQSAMKHTWKAMDIAKANMTR
jgi:hypothetical protein